VFADVEATSTRVCAAPGVPTLAYLAFHQPASPGITGFEFRVVGLPPGWIAIPDFCGPVLCVVGDLFGSGASWGWPICRAGDSMVFGTVLFVAMDTQSNVELTIAARTQPSNPAFNCANVTRCDAPTYTAACVAGDRTVINDAGCPVGTQRQSWPALKRLYE
jgi:hypothetical protein